MLPEVSFRPAAPRVLTCLLLLVGLVAIGTQTAEADSSRLCLGYSACAKAGYSASGYASANRTMYWRMFSGHNCTNYVAYRMVRSGLPNVRPWSGGGNATNWGQALSEWTNQTPRVGAVAWWRAYVSPAGSAGHVAYVERVVSANEIIVSQDSWGGDFSWARITRTGRGWPSGFIHLDDVKLVDTTSPSVTGFAKVGGVLTAHPGTWSQSGVRVGYQWLSNGVAITGATGTTLTLPPARQGQTIAVRVTASKPGYPTASVTSPTTAAVLPGALENTVRPTVTGAPQVGVPMVGSPGSWTPAPSATSYQWLADGAAVPGATTRSLTPTPPVVGKRLSLRVTATRTGYKPVSTTVAAASDVKPGTLRVTAPPTTTGTVTLGRALTVHTGSVSPRGTAAVQWLRGGHPVPGATRATYRLGSGDLGTRMKVRVTWTLAGYTTMVQRTVPMTVLRSTPAMHVTTTPGRHTLTFSAGVTAPGVRPVPGIVRVRSGGVVLRDVPLSHGVARATLHHVRPGTRVFRFRYRGDVAVVRTGLDRTLHIR